MNFGNDCDDLGEGQKGKRKKMTLPSQTALKTAVFVLVDSRTASLYKYLFENNFKDVDNMLSES